MNKDTFYNYIESPEILDEKSLKDLTDLLVDYPYFQAAQMLYSKNLHNINHVKYDSQLKLTSAYLYNRRKLFQLINLKPKIDNNVISKIDSTSQNNEESISNKEIYNIDNDLIIVPEVDIKLQSIIERNNETVIENEIISEINNSESEKQDEVNEVLQVSEKEQLKEIVNVVSINELEALEKVESEISVSNTQLNLVERNLEKEVNNQLIEEIKVSVIEPLITTPEPQSITVDEPVTFDVSETSISILPDKSPNIADEVLQRFANLKQSLDVNNSEKTECIADIILRKSALIKSKKEAENIEIELNTDNFASEKVEISEAEINQIEENILDNSALVIENRIINNETESEEKQVHVETVETFKNKQINETEIKTEAENSQTITVLMNENFAFNDWFNVLKGNTVKNVEEPKSNQKIPESELIEKFINEEPKITPIKNSNVDFNVDISNDTVQESDSFITETLAKIYIKQGYYNKAINIYQKLSLKYSENNTYFAKKIEEVKNLINK